MNKQAVRCEYMQQYHRELRAFCKARKLCTQCGGRVELDKTKCSECLEKDRLRQARKRAENPDIVYRQVQRHKELRHERLAAGVCYMCGRPRYLDNKRCYECMLKNRRTSRKYYKRRERTTVPVPPPKTKPSANHPWNIDNAIVFARKTQQKREDTE